ncbi:MAG: glycoside hydrolase family 78 protein [Prolixibacteraceae bacterium]|nr:glycoside hydrolase family 78 protein [Prolixibacteraceae bacterium]
MKQINRWTKYLVVLFVLVGLNSLAAVKTEVKELVCEYHANPLGIDVQKPRLSWKIVSQETNVMQSAYEIKVTDKTPSGKVLWTSGKVNSDQSVNVAYNGPALKSMQRVYWQVRIWDAKGKATAWSAPAWWEMGLLEAESWKASWINLASEPDVKASKPSQYLRKEFNSAKKVQSARVYVTSLGLYQLFLNGKKVSTDLFTPGWTSYNKRIQYQTYDVTSMIQAKNAMGAILGDGWYRGNIGWQDQRNYYGSKLALLAQLVINYTDGTSETIVSDGSWKASTGPILFSDIYNGETYDARKELTGWNLVGFNDGQWEKAGVLEHTKNTLIAPQGAVVKAIQEIKPVKLITTPKGETVLDMGQNMVGWVRLKVQGKKGDQVTIKFAEVLDKAGNFYTDNLRSAKCTDVYILKGEGEEVFEPHFTFHGFRFVKLEGLSGQPSLDQVTGVVIHSDMTPTGSFTCSEPLINQLQHNIQWGQKGNFLDVPTDCPQRDERLGWTGDIQVFGMTAAYNFNVAPFFTKWLGDVAADQLPNGVLPHVIPDVLKGGGGSTAWADASLIVPWTTYLVYGDKRILEVQYKSMKAWVDYMKNRAGDDLIWSGDAHFGDWLAFASTRSDYTGATTEKDLIATAYYSYSSGLLAKIAAIIGKTDDAKTYAQLSENIKKAFIKDFVTATGRLVSHTQTAYSLALAFNLLPEDLIPKAAAFLAEDVKKMGHLTTGFVGTPLLCKTLSAHGYEDLAFMLLNRQKYPSWLYPVTQGATTIWERWDGQKPDGSFQDVGMNSFNHYAYGAIGEWLYHYVAGIEIDQAKPGYKHFLLAPHPGGGLTNVAAEFESLYGKIKSGWKLDGKQMTYEVTVPANTTATVTLPSASAGDVKLNGQELPENLKSGLKTTDKNVSLIVGSGSYSFSYTMK